MPSSPRSVLWRRLDRPGHEAAALSRGEHGWDLAGSAVFLDADQPVRLDYRIACGEDWVTRHAMVTGWIGRHAVFLRLESREGAWRINGESRSAVDGCIDLDLNFSPSTNLLPIRRLALPVGRSAPVRSAWLRFPSLELEPLEQTYHRLTGELYRYESATGFSAELRVDAEGFVLEYPGAWTVETSERGEAS